MRVLVFSEDKYVVDTLRICDSEEHDVSVSQVDYTKVKSLGLIDIHDIYVFDYRYMANIDSEYLDFLKNLQVEVVVYVEHLNQLKFFMGYNIAAYFCGSISLKKLLDYSQEIYKRYSIMKRIKEAYKNDKVISKNKSEVVVLDIESINYISKERDLMYYYADNRTYLSEDHFDKVVSLLPDYFVRVDKFIIVNFSKVKEINKISKVKYKIFFENGIHHTYVTDYLTKYPSQDIVKKNQESYVIQTIMENCC